ncbi:MAG: glycosyltransferase [Candidatus Omnitrophica bacterium]|nr:glycosyltransferase [Candidatus Omnitrophota bacterium]
MDNPDISVIILTKDGGGTLDRCLSALFSQDIDMPFEVICIDSGSRDDTLDICRSHRVRLFRIEEREFNHGLTRNLAAGKAKGDYIIFLSQDAVPVGNDWMRRLIDNLINDDEAAAAYSRQLPHQDADLLTKMEVHGQSAAGCGRQIRQMKDRDVFENMPPLEKLRFCSFDNVSSCIRKSVWREIPFSETDFAEDLAWARQVLGAGKKIVFEPLSVVEHSHKRGVFYEFRRAYIHHFKTRELFGYVPVPGPVEALLSSLALSFKQIKRLISAGYPVSSTFYAVARTPLICFSRALGQYKGARDAINHA